VLRKGEVKSFFQVGHCFLSVGDEDTPRGKILAEEAEAEPLDGSFDFPLVYVSTSTCKLDNSGVSRWLEEGNLPSRRHPFTPPRPTNFFPEQSKRMP